MSNEKEILNHFFKGDSQRTIAAVLHVSRNTVAKVVQACHEHPIENHKLDRLDSATYPCSFRVDDSIGHIVGSG